METEIIKAIVSSGIPTFVLFAYLVWQNQNKTIPRLAKKFEDATEKFSVMLKEVREDSKEDRESFAEVLHSHQSNCALMHGANREQVGRLISRIPKSHINGV